MSRKIFIIFLIFLLSISCKNDSEWVEMDIIETGCMNEWDDFYGGSNNTKDAVEDYLEHKNISVFNVRSYTYYSGPVCLACTCPTGRLLVISIHESNIEKASALGFQLVIEGKLNVPPEY